MPKEMSEEQGLELESNTIEETTTTEVVEEKDPIKEEVKTPNEKEVQKPKKSRGQVRIETLSKKVREREIEIATLKAKLEEKTSQKNEPDPLDFEDYDDYEVAYEEFSNSKEKPTKAMKLLEKEREEAKKADEFKAEVENLDIKFDDARDTYEDFDELVKSEKNILTKTMVRALNETDKAGEIAYYLAKNLDEAKELSKLSFPQQIKKLTKMEQKLETPKVSQPKKTTNAPEPIDPVSGNNIHSKTVNEMSFPELEAEHNKSTAKKFW